MRVYLRMTKIATALFDLCGSRFERILMGTMLIVVAYALGSIVGTLIAIA
jgi:hypothetical protein